MQENNSNNQNINNVPGNPYTEYYHEYIVDPIQLKNEVPKPKRIASIILCVVSTMMLVSFPVMWIAMAYSTITNSTSVLDFGTSVGASVLLFVYFLPGMLIPAIIAKILNRKNKWPIINIICMSVIFVTVLVLSFFLPKWADDSTVLSSVYRQDVRISEMWNSDVEELLDEYSFDVADNDRYFSNLSGDPYEIRIFVSSEATQTQIDELNDFLQQLRDLDKNSKYRMVIKVYPCYFEPGNNSSFVYTPRYRIEYDSTDREIDIENSLYDDLENRRRVPGHVPEELEEGNLLIVVR